MKSCRLSDGQPHNEEPITWVPKCLEAPNGVKIEPRIFIQKSQIEVTIRSPLRKGQGVGPAPRVQGLGRFSMNIYLTYDAAVHTLAYL
jgi:hypothetical protein